MLCGSPFSPLSSHTQHIPRVKQRWFGLRVYYSSQRSRVFDGSCYFFLFEHASNHVVQDASMFEVLQFHICVKTNFHFEGAPNIQLKLKQLHQSIQSIDQSIN